MKITFDEEKEYLEYVKKNLENEKKHCIKEMDEILH